jgi:hypothetical protein
MITVQLMQLGGRPARQIVAATITLGNDGKLRVSPPKMKYVLKRRVYLYHPETGKEEIIRSGKDPERWIRNLHREIDGSQFWATIPL